MATPIANKVADMVSKRQEQQEQQLKKLTEDRKAINMLTGLLSRALALPADFDDVDQSLRALLNQHVRKEITMDDLIKKARAMIVIDLIEKRETGTRVSHGRLAPPSLT